MKIHSVTCRLDKKTAARAACCSAAAPWNERCAFGDCGVSRSTGARALGLAWFSFFQTSPSFAGVHALLSPPFFFLPTRFSKSSINLRTSCVVQRSFLAPLKKKKKVRERGGERGRGGAGGPAGAGAEAPEPLPVPRREVERPRGEAQRRGEAEAPASQGLGHQPELPRAG